MGKLLLRSWLLVHLHWLSIRILVLHWMAVHAIDNLTRGLGRGHVVGCLHWQIRSGLSIRLGVLVRVAVASLRHLLGEPRLAVGLRVLLLVRVGLEGCWLLRTWVGVGLRAGIMRVLVHF